MIKKRKKANHKKSNKEDKKEEEGEKEEEESENEDCSKTLVEFKVKTSGLPVGYLRRVFIERGYLSGVSCCETTSSSGHHMAVPNYDTRGKGFVAVISLPFPRR